MNYSQLYSTLPPLLLSFSSLFSAAAPPHLHPVPDRAHNIPYADTGSAGSSPEVAANRSHVPLFRPSAYTRVIVQKIPTALKASLESGQVGANQCWPEEGPTRDLDVPDTEIEGSFRRPLTIAAQSNIECLHELLLHNALVNVQRDGLTTVGGEVIFTYSALHQTVRRGSLFGTLMLLKAGANPNIEGEASAENLQHKIPASLHYAVDRDSLH